MRSSPFNDFGCDGGGWSELGGGGSGALLASPVRSKVIVSCALVGTPFNIVLEGSDQCDIIKLG